MAATAAADPIEDPPGVLVGSCGFFVLPGVKKASSAVTVLPIIIAPACFNLETTVQSFKLGFFLCASLPSSVGISSVSKISLIPTGIP